MSNLNDRVALVTGASRGIGAGIARRLAHDGASLTITYNSSPAIAEQVVQTILTAGGKAIAICPDSGDAEAVKSAVAEAAFVTGASLTIDGGWAA